VDYRIAYDTTPFIRESVMDVVKTFIEAVPWSPGGADFPAGLAGDDPPMIDVPSPLSARSPS